MGHYDHRVHAGNAGDVWKHFLLLEAANYLLDSDSSLVYAESHVGRPGYALRAPGDWEGGIGKIQPHLPSLRNFCYFDILADLNQQSLIQGLGIYPGSARLVMELAERKRAKLQAELWDIDAYVIDAWRQYQQIALHLGDGFSGVMSLLDRQPPGLLLIDPPFIDPSEAISAEKLFVAAKEKGCTVLCWYMMDRDALASDSITKFSIEFSKIELDCGRARGCTIALACPNDSLRRHLDGRIKTFINTMQKFSSGSSKSI
ncbi:MAG: 23S rRNA (adenine(2030)-N(6))-methyltransferase RlmJ [Methanothrix sp.]